MHIKKVEVLKFCCMASDLRHGVSPDQVSHNFTCSPT